MDKKLALPAILFLLAFFLIPIAQLDGLGLMPGDIGDARLNNYFLENIYQFFVGNSGSLWHLSFFSPYPYVLGFSDNHFGSALPYLLARVLSLSSETSYQLWFLFGYVCNYAAAFYALRRLNASVLAATVGALIYAFALPTSAHVGHAQMHYRFALPLAIVFLAEFYTKDSWKCLLIAAGWLVWQFYCGIYMGFFTLLLMVSLSLTHFSFPVIKDRRSVKQVGRDLLKSWSEQSVADKRVVIGGFVCLLMLTFLLFYPYLQITIQHRVMRLWGEISFMLPRLESYLVSDVSLLWFSRGSELFDNLPVRSEHQMFVGIVPGILALLGIYFGVRGNRETIFPLMFGMFCFVFILTLYVGGYSLWYLFHWIPVASAIRVMTRIDQALLFPIAYFSVLFIDRVRAITPKGTIITLLLLVPLLVYEASMVAMSTSPKAEWRDRIEKVDALLPEQLEQNDILFFAQREGPHFADEIDAMWVALKLGYKTMNGYSGFNPVGYAYEYGDNCQEVSMRVRAYLRFRKQDNNQLLYESLMSRIVPIGFAGCENVD